MKKNWYESKAVWGFTGFAVFGILNVFFPNPAFEALIVAALGWAGYGVRDALN